MFYRMYELIIWIVTYVQIVFIYITMKMTKQNMKCYGGIEPYYNLIF